jgi:S-methylmethionine-dependent homocysteine/selenocysteine methylase
MMGVFVVRHHASILGVCLAGTLIVSAALLRRRVRRRRDAPIILDGGCGLELKRRKTAGMDVAYDLTLFSTAALRDTPDAIRTLHRDYIRAGCTVITTASYAVTRFYLDKIGEGHRVKELAARSLNLAREAVAAERAENRVLIAASVPPLGESYQEAALQPELMEAQYVELIHGYLMAGGADIYLCETMGNLTEGALAARLCRQLVPSARVWLSFNPRKADASEGGGIVLSADRASVADAVEVAVAVGAELISFNCSTPETVDLAIEAAVAAARGRVQVGGYANFWEEFDPRGWSIDKNESGSGEGDQKAGGMHVRKDLTDSQYACKACGWRRRGAALIGGCCGIGPEVMAEVCRQIREEDATARQ